MENNTSAKDSVDSSCVVVVESTKNNKKEYRVGILPIDIVHDVLSPNPFYNRFILSYSYWNKYETKRDAYNYARCLINNVEEITYGLIFMTLDKELEISEGGNNII